MSQSLDRLAEMVRMAEAKTRAQKLGTETHQAAEALRDAEVHAREVEDRQRRDRPALLRAQSEAAEDEQKLKDLIRKVAQLMGTSALGTEESKQFEREIENTRVELEGRKADVAQKLEALNRDVAEVRRNLQSAMEQYQTLRRELDRLQPQLSGDFSTDDRLARDAEHLFPAGQVRALAREIDDAISHFGMLDPREQLAQLTIWIGRFRRLQAVEAPYLPEEDQAALQRIFPRLVGISKQYEPGYIEAFRQGFTADWDLYVAEAEEQLRVASENARARRETDQRRQAHQAREIDRQQRAREEAHSALDELKGVIVRYSLPEEGVEEFHETLNRVISGMGVQEPELLQLVMPYRDLLTGSDFRALRKHLDRMRQEESKDDPAVKEQYADLLSATKGKRVLMMGGSAREDMRRTLEKLFEFDELDWENYEGARPAFLDSIEQRVRNHGVDLVLILRSFIGHHVPERLRPVCEQEEIPCLMVEHGYGPAQIAETLRKGLSKAG